MKERPIIFNDAMVRAILDGRKTQTRRIVKPQPEAGAQFSGWIVESSEAKREGCATWHVGPTTVLAKRRSYARCPFGQPGDRLWVRECFSDTGLGPVYRASVSERHWLGKWTRSIHMPRWASRITLEITAVRVERLQDISEADALAEGAVRATPVDDGYVADEFGTYAAGFEALWQSIYGAESWQSNPWVWVVEFRRLP